MADGLLKIPIFYYINDNNQRMKIDITGYIGCLGLILFYASCNSPDDVIPRPVISITSPNPNLWNESMTGYVYGIVPKNYKITVYGKIKSGWHNLPNRETTVLNIADDNSWACPLSINQISAISEYVIYLIPSGYSPPILVGANIIPVKLNLVCASKASILTE